MLSFCALWWGAVLVARAMGWSLAWAVSPPAAHAVTMVTSFMPLFMVGFLFTAGPKWLMLPEVEARSLLPSVTCIVIGWLLAIPGFHLSQVLAASGLACVSLGWSILTWRFVDMLRRSRAPDREHALLVACAAVVGVMALWLATLCLANGLEPGARSAAQLALWGFVVPMFVTVSHRMLPFFTASAIPRQEAWRPSWVLWVLTGLLWLQAPLAIAEHWWWPLPIWLRWLQAAVELPAAALLLWLVVHWGLLAAMRVRLLAMLHLGLVWLGAAFALAGVSHGLQAWSAGTLSLGLAPTHALTMGYLVTTLIAMTTRVASGHSGRALVADNPVWVMYWLAHCAAFLRVLAALWPTADMTLLLTAAAAWAAACIAWTCRYGNWFGRIRADGKPG